MELKAKIEELITASLTEEGFELVEIKIAQFRKSNRLQIYVASDTGVKIDDCARVSRTIGPLIDASGLFPHGYSLEVSSPGLDRPLMTIKDFRRRIGERVQISFNDPAAANVAGELTAVDEDGTIELRMDKDTRKFALDTVRMGKIII
ncbi:putative Ribosome maturation factor RimP [Candidatus Zixiibacteriota bacterium]|nr:putative Ribosome maturation factor RimP [candidate division Zixibacteria bacterium]